MNSFSAENFPKWTHYARRLWISVIAGTCRAVENGFQRLISNHHPEMVSPMFRGELSSIFRDVSGEKDSLGRYPAAYGANITCKHSTGAHREHGRNLITCQTQLNHRHIRNEQVSYPLKGCLSVSKEREERV